jgi:cytochrome P450
VVTDVNRRLSRPAAVGGHLLPAGTMVNPAIILVQKDAGHYPRPLVFDPDRFAAQPPDPALWLPFGGGNRLCLGAAYRWIAVKLDRVLSGPACAMTRPPRTMLIR